MVHATTWIQLRKIRFTHHVHECVTSASASSAPLWVTLQNDVKIKTRATPCSKLPLPPPQKKMCLESTFWSHVLVCICFFSHEHYQCSSPVMDEHYVACLRSATSCSCYDHEKLVTSSQHQQSHYGREWASFKLKIIKTGLGLFYSPIFKKKYYLQV